MSIVDLYLIGLFFFIVMIALLSYSESKVVYLWMGSANSDNKAEMLFILCVLALLYPGTMVVTLYDHIKGNYK